MAKPPTSPASSPSVSFNQWLSLQENTRFAPLSKVWTTTRGRLTLNTVVRRAIAGKVSIELAKEAYFAYCDATGLPRVEVDERALAALGPSKR